MRYKKLSLNDAKAIVSQYDKMSDVEFKSLTDHWKSYDTIETDETYSVF